MNVCVHVGNVATKPEVRYSTEGNAVARFSLAVSRFKRDEADFLYFVAFGRSADFVEKYVTVGTKLAIKSHVQTGFYEKDGKRVYTTDFIIDNVEFAGSKATTEKVKEEPEDFVAIPDGLEEELPFV